MLGLKFPCGAELEKLAEQSKAEFNIKPTIKGMDCCLSGWKIYAKKCLMVGRSRRYSKILSYLCMQSN